MADLGPRFGADLTGREVDYLVAEEWAMSAEDVLWRRSKLGLRTDAAGVSALETYLRARSPHAAGAAGQQAAG